jgi:hypothetical protein
VAERLDRVHELGRVIRGNAAVVSLGCDLLQGFLLGRPAESADIMAARPATPEM